MPVSSIDRNLFVVVAGTVGAVVGGGIAAVVAAPAVVTGGAAVATGVGVGAAVNALLK